MFQNILSFISHLDSNLVALTVSYGILIYPLVFLIIFAETGLVFAPFLPGDSLLFAAGAISASGMLNIFVLYFLLLLAAILGDSVNYSIGKYFGQKIISNQWVNYKYIEKTKNFYSKYGNKTIVISRFMPIVRTFAPFVAGIAKMDYKKFLSYNILGSFLWVTIFLSLGFFFGNIPFVKQHFSIVVFGIVFISIIPAIVEFIRYKFSNKN
ncbi:VTT domain-containing protein [Candidatus Pacearchaeota archaeon]|nr:VTT domain-containing protein [Candidatus Pacearchaeota archaeon]